MARAPKTPGQTAKRPEPSREKFFVIDPKATELVIDGKHENVTDEMRQNGVMMTHDEASFYIASGTIGTQPAEPSAFEAGTQAAQPGGQQPQAETQATEEGRSPRRK